MERSQMMMNQRKEIATKGDHENESKWDCLTICTLKENACSSENTEMAQKILLNTECFIGKE
jgi:hypothetical protein